MPSGHLPTSDLVALAREVAGRLYSPDSGGSVGAAVVFAETTGPHAGQVKTAGHLLHLIEDDRAIQFGRRTAETLNLAA